MLPGLLVNTEGKLPNTKSSCDCWDCDKGSGVEVLLGERNSSWTCSSGTIKARYTGNDFLICYR